MDGCQGGVSSGFYNQFVALQYNVLTFYLLANVYIVPICIIAGAFPRFSMRGCVPDILPWESTVPRAAFPNTLPRDSLGTVLENAALVGSRGCIKKYDVF